jgi:predicted nucleic acid-binding protein
MNCSELLKRLRPGTEADFMLPALREHSYRHDMPDFFIGAAAEVASSPLVTANASDFVTYFPTLKIIEP